jgi:ubiquinol-cytochrome c reductase iron-sulfur subunit
MSLLARLLAALAIWNRVVRNRHSHRGLPAPAREPEPEVDPSSRELPQDPRSEGVAALLFVLAGLAGVAFAVLYIVADDTQLLGLAAGLALVFAAAGLFVTGLRVVPQVTHVELRPEVDDTAAQEEVADQLRSGFEGVSRRKLLTAAGGAAAVGVGAVAAVPLASLGPSPGNRIGQSSWERGRRVVDHEGRPILADDVAEGTFVTGFPEGADMGRLGAPVVIVRLDPEAYDLPPQRRDWVPEGIAAYSKICTHAGCAVSLFRSPLDQSTAGVAPALVCPCHYSTFDPARGAEVTFGPAGRALPQLPLMIGPGRELRAAGPYSAPVGPAWWGTPH